VCRQGSPSAVRCGGDSWAGTVTGQRVLHILGKRRVDLTEDDEKTMRRVVDRVHAQRGNDLEPTARQENWRHRLMSIGHDPLKPA
jgi:hypothetical protein